MPPDLPETLSLDRLVSLVDHRTEEPDVEYKAWMDLSLPEAKSAIAKHLCALSNYGGGWLVFGVSDDGSHTEPHPGDLSSYRQDIINSIVSRYLHPPFHCNVYFVPSAITQKKYPIVLVPPHGAQPVCAKADRPINNKQRIGVTKGTHYIRVPGPSSAPIDSPELWRTLLHRCVLLEREQLLSSIGRLFEKPSIAADAKSPLSELLENTTSRWDELQKTGWLVDPKINRTTLAFQFLTFDKQPVQTIALSKLANGIREASNAAESECEGFKTFDMFYGGLATSAVFLFHDREGYETDAVFKKGAYLFAPALSRALITGMGVEVRPYHEDTDWVRSVVEDRSTRKWPVGGRLSPRFQANRIFGFVAFVRHLARAFSDANEVRLIADYKGLAGRTLDDTKGGVYYSRERKSVEAERRIEIVSSLERLIGTGGGEVASLLLNPILRLFEGWEINADYIRKAAKDPG